MNHTVNDFSRYLTYFLSKYLPGQQNVSPNTIMSYRDTFKLFLTFCEEQQKLQTECITMNCITTDLIIGFLNWIEDVRKCSIATRNQRLAAIHAFFRYVQKQSPENLFEIQKILAIPIKKKPKPIIPFLSPDELKIVFAQPDQSRISGKRDLAMMVTLYDTGARVQELIDLTYKDVRLDKPAVVKLHGKGRKVRTVPIMGKTFTLLSEHMALSAPNHRVRAIQDMPIFCNQQNRKFTRRGIAYIIKKYVSMARNHPDFKSTETITPHTFRHVKAVHLLQAGVNIIYIRDFLGHVNVSSTEIYIRADNSLKRKALENAYYDLTPEEMPSWADDSNLMKWLQNLCR